MFEDELEEQKPTIGDLTQIFYGPRFKSTSNFEEDCFVSDIYGRCIAFL